eukprot:gb/GEZN01002228.1/.p1 GENE.gb/GEZN01002228.1/~~gb/GEZN01002228.1/.p1  ORF type:complete len:832 (+),score=130.25 gb/GEZN01002228.1/:20-2515(+)
MVFFLGLAFFVASATKSILDKIGNESDLGTLRMILKDFPDIETALNNKNKQYTVFTPTDDAFLGVDMSMDQAKLKQILQYHVVMGQIFAADIASEQTEESVSGEALILSRSNGKSAVNDVLFSEEIDTDNGVIHKIPQVLMPPSVYRIVQLKQGLSSLESLLNMCNTTLVPVLNGHGAFTLFAPSNAAVAAFQRKYGNRLNKDQLQRVLTYHVLPQSLDASQLRNGYKYVTLNGQKIMVQKSYSGGIKINDALVTEADLQATNGVVHVIDKVLLPPFLFAGLQNTSKCKQAADNIWQCQALAEALQLQNTYPWRFKDSAYPPGCYLKNDQYLWYNAETQGAPCSDVRKCVCQEVAPPAPTKTLAQILKSEAEDKSLTLLLQLLKLNNSHIKALWNAASDPSSNLTLFAPNDAAFETLFSQWSISPSDLHDTQIQGFMAKVLKYHLLPKALESSQIKPLQFPLTLLTDSDTVKRDGGAAQVVQVATDGDLIKVNEAQVISADIMATNGVMHIINKVLPPPADTTVILQKHNLTFLAALVGYFDLSATLNDEPGLTIFAPSDAAFKKLLHFLELNQTVKALVEAMDAPNSTLKKTVLRALQFHVSPIQYFSTDLCDKQTLTTLLQGKTLEVAVSHSSGDLALETGSDYNTVNKPSIIMANILSTNAAIHVIDNVLLPADEKAVKKDGRCDDLVWSLGGCEDEAERLNMLDQSARTINTWQRPPGCFFDSRYKFLYWNRYMYSPTKCTSVWQCLCSSTPPMALLSSQKCNKLITEAADCENKAQSSGTMLYDSKANTMWSSSYPAGCVIASGYVYFNYYPSNKDCSNSRQCLCN